jgi:protein-L-isoaspartate O-methyltransferase
MQHVQEMQEYYGKRADVYDASMGYDDPKTVEGLAPVIALMKELLQDRSVLEIACGPCFWTNAVSPAAKSILATDYNMSVLELARRKPLDRNKIELQVADAYALPALPTTYDACMAVDWFAHVPRSRFHGFLQGIHAKLATGALVVFCDQTPGAHSLTNLHDAEGNHLQERTLPDGSRYRVIKHFLTDEELRSIFDRYSPAIRIERFPECRRIVVSYMIKGEQHGGGYSPPAARSSKPTP